MSESILWTPKPYTLFLLLNYRLIIILKFILQDHLTNKLKIWFKIDSLKKSELKPKSSQ